MKIVIMIPTLGMGGAERVATELANWLVKKNLNIYLLNMESETNNFKIDTKVRVFNKNQSYNKKFKKYNIIGRGYKFIKNKYLKTKYILDTLNVIKPDIIFEMLYYPIPYLVLYKMKNRKTIIIGSERNNPQKRNKKIIEKTLAKFAPNFCDGYIFQTTKVKEMFSKKIQNKSIVIPNAVSNPYINEIDINIKKEKVVSNVGRLNYQKGQDTLIKAFKIVNEKFPEYKLVIYGEGQKRTELEELIEKLNLKNKVILPGKKENVIKEIVKSEIFVFSSRYEGMPNALLEAMACGLPCISTDCVAGPSEIIRNGHNGLLVEVDNEKEIAEKIMYLIENKKIAKSLGKEARNVLQEYSKDTIFNKYYIYFYGMYRKNKEKNTIFDKIFIKLKHKGLTNIIPDKLYLKMFYKYRMGKKLNINNPQTFNEKLQWLKLYDRNPEYTKMVDKYEVKKYVANIIGEEYIIPTIGIYNKFEDIDFEKLPNQFVMKCTHDSGGIVICRNKNQFNIEEAKNKIDKFLKRKYFYHGREWPYKNVEPRIIIEKYMKEENKEELTDYKMMCFNGKVKCSFTCLNRNSPEGLNVDFYDIDWNKMPFERYYRNSSIILEKPKNYEKMIQLSEKLSKNIPFVRVDFYEINNKLYFGELTFYPGNGCEYFNPEHYDKKLGDWIELPNK